MKEAASAFSTDETVDELKGIFGDAYAVETSDGSSEALLERADAALATFNQRRDRRAKELKEARALARRV